MKLTLPSGRTWPKPRWVLGHWILSQLWWDFDLNFDQKNVWFTT